MIVYLPTPGLHTQQPHLPAWHRKSSTREVRGQTHGPSGGADRALRSWGNGPVMAMSPWDYDPWDIWNEWMNGI